MDSTIIIFLQIMNMNEEQIIHGYQIDGAMCSSGAEIIDGWFT